MKIELDHDDIEAISKRTLELIRPLLSGKKEPEEDIIFDVQGVADYLKTSKKWVYAQTHLKTIPHYKLGNNQVRFKKSEIDTWLKSLKIPAAGEPTGQKKLATTVIRMRSI